jgi:hypothetical protein
MLTTIFGSCLPSRLMNTFLTYGLLSLRLVVEGVLAFGKKEVRINARCFYVIVLLLISR